MYQILDILQENFIKLQGSRSSMQITFYSTFHLRGPAQKISLFLSNFPASMFSLHLFHFNLLKSLSKFVIHIYIHIKTGTGIFEEENLMESTLRGLHHRRHHRHHYYQDFHHHRRRRHHHHDHGHDHDLEKMLWESNLGGRFMLRRAAPVLSMLIKRLFSSPSSSSLLSSLSLSSSLS